MRCHYYNITTSSSRHQHSHWVRKREKKFHNTIHSRCSQFLASKYLLLLLCIVFYFWENGAHALQTDYTHFHYNEREREREREIAIFIRQTKSNLKYFRLFLFSHIFLPIQYAAVHCSFQAKFFTCFLMEMCNMCCD